MPDELKHRPRADTAFSWTPPEGAPVEFSVALWPDGGVQLGAVGPLHGVVAGLRWDDERKAIRDHGNFWARNGWTDLTRSQLLLHATNALRVALSLPPHPAPSSTPVRA